MVYVCSWHEMGEFDVPAILDYVTTATEQARVPVVGHSMGNTMMMVMGALRPEYNRLVSVHVALAPTVFLQHAQSPILKGFAALAPTVSVSVPESVWAAAILRAAGDSCGARGIIVVGPPARKSS